MTADGEPPKRSALVSRLIGNLQHNIADGRWPVGSRIPKEVELAAEHGVSRITLRQAVQALVHVGVLETVQGSGTFVRATTELDAVLRRFLGGEDLATVLEVRLAIEGEATALAATRADEHDLARLDGILGESRDALARADAEALTELSTRFHRAVVDAARNPILTHFYRAIRDGAERSVRDTTPPAEFASFVDQHAAITDAIRAGERDRAQRLAREHLLPLLG
ncbi:MULTISPECIES: FadR/GntR family transcriptional regulator [unclassified Saccharopolyspora]|uniref:FadR/GntR family transcriptional regulator n=1 Tax=unclassified Saccharopolyspora TaxID=2646250 RepID=UPI001CD4CA97|nr:MULTISPECIES: FCD domain-containing protein [unclassified Saccharopolyspora]MCA1184935.1 FCD domain-containing protein [Saccharopolyspora sp. 6T]MCA1190656.1 FCD domain-containing protein [Saccharopolyspora sp. 6V]MCA1225438.1 FCD domain-containing protein [Saccharopolyspora sp. 6M]MCA1279899.1 FCD domain-containing protein [Saccharopolyspora sp. 7B]